MFDQEHNKQWTQIIFSRFFIHSTLSSALQPKAAHSQRAAWWAYDM